MKINNDTMTTIVVFSLGFCVIAVVAAFVMACFGINTDSILQSTLTVFGTELAICGLMKIIDRRNALADRKKKDDTGGSDNE